jgi:ribosome-binding factor A
MGDEKEKQEVLQTLAAASGFLHKELRGRLTLHYIPELSFHRDDTIERGAQVLQLIERSESSSEGNQGEH